MLSLVASSSFSWTRETSSKMRTYGITLFILAEKNVRQASGSLQQGKSMIVAGFSEAKKDHGYELIQKLEAGVQDMRQIVEDWKRDVVAPKDKEILQYVEEDMVDGFPYEVPAECINMHLIKGRATVVLDGYNAPVTARNFVDLVERHFYDGMEIQRLSELTPSNSNILDGRYAIFGYVTQNEDFMAVKVGDVIKSIQVVSG
ncbi:hypothetical protein HID58_006138 [Brassica napus]|uniref:peptidylprolyl isomerase n=1 Tax=Brassica napus TaxID=3708 RepID=A0ABQ8EBB8_BRANA|nr:hypothetical protein HID58_006138 [Brassica napus]